MNPSSAASSQPTGVQVACLCAAWCGVCREYAPPFEALAITHPQVRFHWVDVEDDAAWVDDLDVENFPTVLIGVGGEPVFYGTVLPHVQTLERLLQDATSLRPLSGAPEYGTLKQLLIHLDQRGA